MKFIAIINNKGGIGKTTSAVNLAASFAKMNQRCLLVDLDPSASASLHFGFDKSERDYQTICDLLLNPERRGADYIYPVGDGFLHCLPSEPALSEFLEEMIQEEEQDFFLRREDFPDRFEIVLFDSPPNMGNLALNALAISDYALIPIQTQYLGLSGLEVTLNLIERTQRHLNPKLKILGVFGTQYDRRTRVAKEVYQLIQKRFPKKTFNTVVGVNSKLIEAFHARKPIIEYAPSARGAKEYMALAEEILNRMGMTGGKAAK